MCKGQCRSGPEVQGKENEATDRCAVKDRGFKKIRELE